MRLLLDTHVFLWLMMGDTTLSNEIKDPIYQAAKANTLYISAISIWEIAMLADRGRISLRQPIKEWVQSVLKTPGLTLLDLTPDVLCESVVLPGEIHKDPADRMIIATARIHNTSLLTRDELIFRYASQGHLSIMPA